MDKNDRNALMKKLRMLDFAVQECALYLDAYPDNAAALEYYEAIRDQRDEVYGEYEKKYGPITIFGNNDTASWQWTNGPWPWETEAN